MKVFTGKVIKADLPKTIRVEVERVVIHPLYKKRFRRAKAYYVHDEIGVKVGETVKFAASRPYSKLKKWKVIEKVDNKSQSKRRGKTK